MRLPAFTPLPRRWPLFCLAALLLLIALTVLLAGPGTAQAHGPHGKYNPGHVHFTDLGEGRDGGPHAPTGFAQPTFTDGEIELHWTPATTGPTATHWLIAVHKDGESTTAVPTVGRVGSERSYTISELEPGVRYDVFLRGRTGANFGDRAFASVVAGVKGAPAFLYAEDKGTTLTVTFNQNLDTSSAPAGSAFTVTIAAPGGTPRTIAGTGTAALSGRTATVTLASAVAHARDEKVTLSYAKPSTNPLRDTSETETASFSGKRMTDYANLGHAHFMDQGEGLTGAPEAPTGYAEPGFGDGLIEVKWTPATAGAAASFWAVAHRKVGADDWVSNISIPTSTRCTPPGMPPHTPCYPISGLEPGALYDIVLRGRNASGLGDRAEARVAAGVTDGPNFASAMVSGNVLTLTFDRALNGNQAPAYDNFEVRTRHNGGEGIPSCLGECAVPVTAVSISGAEVTLTLAQAIPSHATTWLKYSRPSRNPLIGQAIGYPANPFNEPVPYATPDTTAPLFSSARLYPYWTDCDWRSVGGRTQWRCLPTYDEKAFLRVAFNELVDEDRTPPGSAFRVTSRPPGGSARTVAVTGTVNNHGNEVAMEIGPVPGGQAAKITVSYVKPSHLWVGGDHPGAGDLRHCGEREPVGQPAPAEARPGPGVGRNTVGALRERRRE